MLKGLDPAVAKAVASRWGEDQRAFFEAARKKVKGKGAHEWGTQSCKKCFGRGYTGTVVESQDKVICKCASKNYQKWLQTFRAEFNATRDEQDDTNEQTQTATSGPEDTQEALPNSEA